jgi:hypothetical protein
MQPIKTLQNIIELKEKYKIDINSFEKVLSIKSSDEDFEKSWKMVLADKEKGLNASS